MALLCSILPVSAQWSTQSFDLVPGWNAVYLHVDASHETLSALVGSDAASPIQEVWRWQPAPGTAQFVTSPQLPTTTGSRWVSWSRVDGAAAELQRLTADAAYLVRIDGAAGYRWDLKGKPAPPGYLWTSTGLNFIGFPTPTVAAPTFESFLSPAPSLRHGAEVFRYEGGELGPSNPALVFAFRTTTVRRGEAVWIRAGGSFNNYYGPFELALDNRSGMDFGPDVSLSRFRLKNLTTSPLTVTLRQLASEAPPVGQAPIAGPPPLLLRGALNLDQPTHAFAILAAGPQVISLAPAGRTGSEAEVFLGLNRSRMPGQPGAIYAGILRLADSLGFSQIDVPVSARVPSRSGLWVGAASVDTVRHYLRTYPSNPDGTLPLSATGAYVPGPTNTSPGAVSRAFPLRLIVHCDGTNSTLLQRVFHGLDAGTNRIVSTREALLDPRFRDSARRISAGHLPWSGANAGWEFDHPLGSTNIVRVTVPLSHDDQSSNPFLHTYHPDHDGRDSVTGSPLERGMESYDVTRVMTLTTSAPGDDFESLTENSTLIRGTYSETVTLRGLGSSTRQFDSSGQFLLNRVSEISPLRR